MPGLPGNFDEVHNSKVVDDWNAQLATLDPTAAQIKPDEVTTTGDGYIFGSSAAPAGPKQPVKRDPLHEKAYSAIHAYDKVDRMKMNVNALFSEKDKDVKLVQSLQARGGYVANDGSNNAPLGATYVMAKVWKDAKGKVVRQFASSGIIVDKTPTTITVGDHQETAEKWTTMKVESMNAVTESAIRDIQFTSRVVAKMPEAGMKAQTEIIGWFVPESMPQPGEGSGEGPVEYKDAYSQTNKVTRHVLDEKTEAEEARKLVLTGHAWMGADWHANEDFGFRFKQEYVLDEHGEKQFEMTGGKMVKGKRVGGTPKKDRDGNPKYLMRTTTERERISKAIAKDGAKRQELAYKIYAGNPDLVRNPAGGGKGSYYTTCVETATKILSEYGIDTSIFGYLMSPVFEDPKADSKPRDAPIFKYLQECGAWVWAAGEENFMPKQGDVFLTGTYMDVVNAKKKTYGMWTFQHVGIVAAVSPNPDGTLTVLSQDGGKGMAALGEDKTGYTQRTYDPKTRLMSGAKPKTVIGVWRPALLKAALQQLPPEIKATLKTQQAIAYDKYFETNPYE